MADTQLGGSVHECNDCGADPGTPHQDGCDVARCTLCGWQRISCEHADGDGGWGQLWTGEWPGDVECREVGLFGTRESAMHPPMVKCEPDHPDRTPDLNALIMLAAQGLLTWNGQRWVRSSQSGRSEK